MARIVSFVVLLAILLVIGILFLRVMAGFLLPLFLAAVLVVMFRPLHQWMVGRCKGRSRLAAGLTTLAILVIVLAPLLGILGQAAAEAATLLTGWNQQSAQDRIDMLRRRLDLNLPPAPVQETLDQVERTLNGWIEQIPGLPPSGDVAGLTEQLDILEGLLARPADDAAGFEPPDDWQAGLGDVRGQVQALAALRNRPAAFDNQLHAAMAAFQRFHRHLLGGTVRAWLTRLVNPDAQHLAALRQRLKEFAGPMAVGGAQFAGSFLVEFVVGLAIMIVALYYFLADGPAMIDAFMRLSPLEDHYERQLFDEFASVSRAVVVATLLSALVQGLLAGLGYFVAGLEAVFLLVMLTMLFALIPFVGATAIWLPCSLWLLLFEDRPTAALLLAVYGLLVVSMADNVIKPLVLRGRSNMHPLLALLSVLGGVKAMGPIGILVGPMVVAFLQPLLHMLQTELRAFGRPSS